MTQKNLQHSRILRQKRNMAIIFYALLSCANYALSNEPRHNPPTDARPIALSAEQQQRTIQDNGFAFDLLRQTIASNTNQQNVFISPLSVSIALGMAWNGANGNTKTEMGTTLKMRGLSTKNINSYYKVMQSTLPRIDPTTKLCIANSMWYKTGFKVKNSFLNTNKTYFNAYVKVLDFRRPWAKDTINNWCSKHTNNLIPTILDKIPDEAVMYLTNAVYFKGLWQNKFDKQLTSESEFTNESQNKVKVNMMYQKEKFGYAIDDKAQYLDMPYGNKAFSMTVILPSEGKTTNDVLNQLTAEKWNTTLNQLNQQEVMVYMPRFKTECKFSLKPELISMGMKRAFSNMADFSGIADTGLMISDVIHKTYITVDEEGTEAAAVTNIGIVATSMPIHPIFRADKPFLVVIREKSTGVILFVGKIGNVERY